MFKDILSLRFTLTIIGLGVLIIVLGVAFKSHNENVMQRACEAKGGVLLEHTYQVGKLTENNYICIDPNIIIKY